MLSRKTTNINSLGWPEFAIYCTYNWGEHVNHYTNDSVIRVVHIFPSINLQNLLSHSCQSVWRPTHYDISDKNNNVSTYIHRPCWTRCDTSNNFCLNLQNWHYSIFITQTFSQQDIVKLYTKVKICQIFQRTKRDYIKSRIL